MRRKNRFSARPCGAIDWAAEIDDLRAVIWRQLERRGRTELDEQVQDAICLLLVRSKSHPEVPVALAIWYATGDVARGRTVHRIISHGHVDALHYADAPQRNKLAAEQAESFTRRALLAQSDLDI